jgi:tRNA (Thr-GGU) A37 N-methylase
VRLEIEPVAFVRAARAEPEDDFWGGAEARIELVPGLEPEALAGIEEFSHV